MRITIVNGFFLPVPPAQGGSTEKSWYRLARLFVAQGHQVTLVSRRWPGWPDEEVAGGLRHLRLRGYPHEARLARNLWLDWWWSWRVFRALPPADIVVVNTVALPVWLGWLRPRAGRVVIMTGRMPKGQYRFYRRIARVLAASSHVLTRVVAENSRLARVARVCGYPIDATLLAATPRVASATGPVAIGFVGRLHEEKGLRLMAEALARLATVSGLPAFEVVFCGPLDVGRGGSGPQFQAALAARLAALPAGSVRFLEPRFDDRELAAVYAGLDLFCYPSLAEQGETFGVAVAEAMAAGAVPVVSQLACFTDFVRHEENGLVFDHRAPDAADRLAGALARLIRDAALRRRLANAGRDTVRRYDYPIYAGELLADFARLTGQAPAPSSAP